MKQICNIFVSLCLLACSWVPTLFLVYADTINSFEIVPKADTNVVTQTHKTLSSKDTQHQFRDVFNKTASNFENKPTTALANQLATGAITWDTIINLAAYLINFISNLGLVAGSAFIIYAGYQYVMSGFGAGDEKKGPGYIKNAIIGVMIITVSYGLFRLLAKIFIE